MQASRRGFLRSALATGAAATALSVGNFFGPAKRVEAQTGIIGVYPRRIAQYCPPYNSNDQCQPGCGSSPICTDCCTSDGFFRNEPSNGYTLYPGGCGDGDVADGWLWRYSGVCGNCATIEYRCSDGYVQTDTGPAPFICRWVTHCEALPEGTEPGPNLVDAARPTNWRPASSLELAVDNGGSVTLQGWIADATRQPVSMRVTANGQIVHFGTAALARPDVSRNVPGAGPNTGFAVSFPLDPGDYRFCVDALANGATATVGCVNMTVGSGQTIRGPGASGSIPSTPAPPTDSGSGDPSPTPTPTPTPGPTAVPVLPEPSTPSDSAPYGAVRVIRRSGSDTAFVSGWAGDADTDDAAFIEISVAGTAVALVRPNLPRPDVAAAFPNLGTTTGFALSVEVPAAQVEVCIDAVGPDDGLRRSLGCRILGAAPEPVSELTPPVPPTSVGSRGSATSVVYGGIDEVEVVDGSGVVRGWAFDPNDYDVAVNVTVAGVEDSVSADADLRHAFVGDTYGVPGKHGFELAVALTSGSNRLVITATTGSASPATIGEQTLVAP